MRRLLVFLSFFSILSVSKANDVRQLTVPNWPSNYAITGSVLVANFPSTQTIVAAPPTQLSYFKNVSVSSAPIQIKTGAGEIWGFYIYNNATAGNERSVKFFDRATAPTVGVTASNFTITCGGRSNATMPFLQQVSFNSGLWIIATTASGDNAATGPANGEVSIWVLYK